jgi:ribonuclease P protein component
VRAERFTPIFRLRHKREYDAVYAGRARAERGPLIVHAIPNALGHHRLGLAVGRRLGSAPRRNRLKRKIREVFRTTRTRLPGAYDLVVSARAHEDADIERYRSWLAEAIEHLHATWTRRNQRALERSGPQRTGSPPSPSPPAD